MRVYLRVQDYFVLNITTFFRWYDLWIGAYWDRVHRKLYICPLPMIGVVIQVTRPIQTSEPHRHSAGTAACRACTRELLWQSRRPMIFWARWR